MGSPPQHIWLGGMYHGGIYHRRNVSWYHIKTIIMPPLRGTDQPVDPRCMIVIIRYLMITKRAKRANQPIDPRLETARVDQVERLVSIIVCVYESIATVGESRVWWRADFQSGSRVLKKVF